MAADSRASAEDTSPSTFVQLALPIETRLGNRVQHE
jgi:hypothetical protein